MEIVAHVKLFNFQSALFAKKKHSVYFFWFDCTLLNMWYFLSFPYIWSFAWDVMLMRIFAQVIIFKPPINIYAYRVSASYWKYKIKKKKLKYKNVFELQLKFNYGGLVYALQ